VNEIPIQYDSKFGQTIEFTNAVYDILAPPSFVSSPFRGPCFIFLIDLSVDAVSSGFALQSLSSIKASLDSLSPTTRVGLLTMSNVVTVCDFQHSSEFVVSDLSDPALPFRCTTPLSECRSTIDERLNLLISKSGEARSTGHCLVSALLVAQAALADSGGIIVACCAGPTTVGPFAVAPRPPDPGPEVMHLRPPDDATGQAHRTVSRSLNESGASVHLFNLAVPGRPSDIAVTGLPSGMTGGVIHFYRTFDPSTLHTDLFECISGDYLWDASLRIRSTPGVKVATATGNMAVRDRAVFPPVMSVRHSIGFEVQIDAVSPRVVFQCGTLFTDASLRRVIRVMTFSIPTASDLESLRSAVDEAAFAAFSTKRAASSVTAAGVAEASARVKSNARSIASRQFRLSSTFHLLHSLSESPLMRIGASDVPDSRMAALMNARSFSAADALLFLYPRMFAVDAGAGPLPLVRESFAQGFVFLVHTLKKIFVWISPAAPPEIVRAFIGDDTRAVGEIGTKENEALNGVIAECYAFSGKYLPVEVVPAESEREAAVFRDVLVDIADGGAGGLQGFIADTLGAFR
jgi:hypothetical protein